MSSPKPPSTPFLFTPRRVSANSLQFNSDGDLVGRWSEADAEAENRRQGEAFEKQKARYADSNNFADGGHVLYLVPKAPQTAQPTAQQERQVVYMQAPAQTQYSAPAITYAPPKAPDPRRAATGKYVQDPIPGEMGGKRLVGTGTRSKTILTDPAAVGGLGSGDMLVQRRTLG